MGADERQSWWASPAVGWTLIGLGVASGAVSGVSFAVREDRASQWNNESECVTSDGATRLDTCGSVKDEIDTAETIGVVTGIAGVALLGAGITHLIATGGSNEEDPVSTPAEEAGLRVQGCGAGFLSIACHGSF